MELLEGERVLAFDLETTGISTSRDRIVSWHLLAQILMVLRFPMTSWSILEDPFLMNRSESTAFQIPMSGVSLTFRKLQTRSQNWSKEVCLSGTM